MLRDSPPDSHEFLERLRALADPEVFTRAVLPAYFRAPGAAFHRTLFSWQRRMMECPLESREGLRFALAAPRGHAKSTLVSLAMPLHDVIGGTEPYILLLSATDHQAGGRLRSIRKELERGALAAYAPITEASSHHLIANATRIEARGAGCELRGLSHGENRPTKIILDDAESSASVSSRRRREHLIEWFGEVVEHLGDRRTHLLAIGTILHPKGLLATLLERADFTPLRLCAIEAFAAPSDHWRRWMSLLTDKSDPEARRTARKYFLDHRAEMEAGTRVLWPERWDYEELAAQLQLQGRRAFYREMQNTPLGPDDALFDPERVAVARWDGDQLVILKREAGVLAELRRIEVNRRSVPRVAFLDPALGRRGGTGDFAAIAVVAVVPRVAMVIEHLWARKAAPAEQVRALFDINRMAPLTIASIENAGFQELLRHPVEEERRRRQDAGESCLFPVDGIAPKGRKEARIATLEPLFGAGQLLATESLDEEFWVELANWPRSDHDDALDALAGAVASARRYYDSAALAEARTLPRRAGGTSAY